MPGDVVVLQRGKATCDMVLLKGSCLVEESMLSGEVGLSLCTHQHHMTMRLSHDASPSSAIVFPAATHKLTHGLGHADAPFFNRQPTSNTALDCVHDSAFDMASLHG